MLKWFKIYVSGIFMGAADVVPGVSGGTIAFILGIYDRLINALSGVNTDSIRWLLTGQIRKLWQHFDGTFLCVLGAGILTSILVFAQVITYWLETYPVFLWSFFFGLILASAVYLIAQIERFKSPQLLALMLGGCVGVAASIMVPTQIAVSTGMIFISGMIAICAMILPGISGSFILLMLGMYGPVMQAIKTLQFDVIGIFASGAVVGLLSFSKILKWLLDRYHAITLSGLTGIMLGALVKVWPWKETKEWIQLGDKQVSAVEALIFPWQQHTFVLLDDVLLPLLCLLTGIMSVVLINYIFLPKKQTAQN